MSAGDRDGRGEADSDGRRDPSRGERNRHRGEGRDGGRDDDEGEGRRRRRDAGEEGGGVHRSSGGRRGDGHRSPGRRSDGRARSSRDVSSSRARPSRGDSPSRARSSRDGSTSRGHRRDRSPEDVAVRRAREAARIAARLKKARLPDEADEEREEFGGPGLAQALPSLPPERFVWGKKIEKALAEGATAADFSAEAEAERAARRRAESERVARDRERRAAERGEAQRAAELAAREKAGAEAAELEARERALHAEAARGRADRRLREGRARVIDVLAALCYGPAPLSLYRAERREGERAPPSASTSRTYTASTSHRRHPLRLLQREAERGAAASSELRQQILEFAELEAPGTEAARWWESVLASADAARLAAEREAGAGAARAAAPARRARGGGAPPDRDAAWHQGVDDAVSGMLRAQGSRTARELLAKVQAKLNDPEEADPEFWAGVLAGLRSAAARAAVAEMHREFLRRGAAEAHGGGEALVVGGDEGDEGAAPPRGTVSPGAALPSSSGAGSGKESSAGPATMAAAVAAAARQESACEPQPWSEARDASPGPPRPPGSPRGLRLSELPRAARPVDAAEDTRDLERLRAEARRATSERRRRARRAAAAAPTAARDRAAVEAVYRQAVADPQGAATLFGGATSTLKNLQADAIDAAAGQGGLGVGLLASETPGDGDGLGDAPPGPAERANAAALAAAAGLADDPLELGLGGASPTRRAEREAQERAFLAVAEKAMGADGGDAFGAEALDLNPTAPSAADPGSGRGAILGPGKPRGGLGGAAAPDAGPPADPFALRKPKYFNRVHAGYDWNRYNKTHFDGDNPPPKTVQGYKFNIFYPDLVGGSRTGDPPRPPSYSVRPDPASPDGSTCLLVFHAGPPYLDLTFRIVNKPWEHNHKRGFKSVFEKGILHLYFNFKREWYRR